MSNTTEIKEIIVYRWKYGQKFTCQSCGKGKFEAKEQVNNCPKCGQGHAIRVQL